MPPRYAYQKFSTVREIRLLKLSPGNFEDEVRLQLTHASLDALPSYEALSYTWGAATEKIDVACNASGDVLSIFTSLHLILRYLRHEHQARTLWIDAVCINQDDTAERNLQVPLMREIYSRAAGVVAWVGEESEADKAVFDIGNRKPDQEGDGHNESGGTPQNGSSELDTVGGKRDKKVHKEDASVASQLILMVAGLTIFLRRPWFSRVWIIQEAALGSNLVLQCSHRTLEWEVLMGGCEVLFEASRRDRELVRADQTLERIRFVDTVRSMTQANKQVASPNSELPFSTFEFESSKPGPGGRRGDMQFFVTGGRHHDATNPRDHVYGLLGLVDDPEQSMVAVDYDKKESVVYGDFVKGAIKGSGNLDILGQAYSEDEPCTLPSWIPDWSSLGQLSPISSRRHWGYGASHASAEILPSEPNVLRLSGIFVDTIQEVSDKLEISVSEDASSQDRSLLLQNIDWALSKVGESAPAVKDIATKLKYIYTPKTDAGNVIDSKPATQDDSVKQFVNAIQPGAPRLMFRLFAKDVQTNSDGTADAGGPMAMLRSVVEEALPQIENLFLGPVHSTSWDDTKIPAATERQWADLARKCKKYPTREPLEDVYWRTLIGDRRTDRMGNGEQPPPEWKDAFGIWHELAERTEGVLPRLKRGRMTKVREQVHPLVLDALHISRPAPETVPEHLVPFFREAEERRTQEQGKTSLRRTWLLYSKLTGKKVDLENLPDEPASISFEKQITTRIDSRPSGTRQIKDQQPEKSVEKGETASKGNTVQQGTEESARSSGAEEQKKGKDEPEAEKAKSETTDEKEEEDSIRVSIRRVARQFDRDVLRMARNRRFCTTKKGYVGWAPPGAQKGDQVCILLGGQVPYVVRPVKGGYKYLGEAYIHGVMNGEASAIGHKQGITLV